MRDGLADTAAGSGETGGGGGVRRLHPASVQRFGWWLGLITAGGLALRVIVVVISRNEAVGGDGFAYSYTANRNVTGHWFINLFNQKPDAIHPPVWTLILTVWA